jgi:hypothetical protein
MQVGLRNKRIIYEKEAELAVSDDYFLRIPYYINL